MFGSAGYYLIRNIPVQCFFGSQKIKIKISEKLIRILQVRIPYGIRNTTSILLKSSCAVTGNRHKSKEI